ncbi:MAG TPA: hypothetical protein ENK06_09970 [Gammaproteobacteria bacterium]|nr:hypothetical protein [Gammaproteobacteria bacterium]
MNIKALAVSFGLLFVSGLVQATPFLYTFEGEVNLVVSDIGSDPVDSGGTPFNVGDAIEYQFIADRALPGSCNPTTADGCDFTTIPGVDYFFADLVSANREVSFGWNDATLNYGIKTGNTSTQLSGSSAISILTDNSTHPLSFTLPPLVGSPDIATWLPGGSLVTGLLGLDSWLETDDSGQTINQGNVWSTLNLTSVVAIAVPEPSTLALFAGTLLLIPFYQRNKRRVRLPHQTR